MTGNPSLVTGLVEAFRRSKALFTAVSLGIFDRLHQQPSTADELASAVQLNASALARLLDACVGLGLLEKAGGTYSNRPDIAPYVRRDSPETLAGYILYSNQVLFPMWVHLEDAIREGTNRWRQTFGVDGPIFAGFFRTPESRRTFLAAMHGFGLLSSPAIVRAFDLSRFHHIADLGGATGHLALAACECYGHLHATVFDLPEVIEFARPYAEASCAAPRLSLVSGDFFADPLPAADLYALGRILHDWDETKINTLLARIHAALPPGGAILIAEALLNDDGCGPVSAQMQSLNMLICTEGRERSPCEYRALLEAAGFTKVEARRTGAPLDAVLALKEQ